MPVLTTSASAALAAADAQTIALPGETDTATLVKPTARKLLDLEIKDTDKLMAAQFRTHLRAKISNRWPACAPAWAPSSSLSPAATHTFATAGRLASHAGLVPLPRDFGRVTGNLHRPRPQPQAATGVYMARCPA